MAAGCNLETYHGTDVDFNEFKRRRHTNGNIWGSVFYFADAEDASQAVVDGLKERGVPVRTYENGNQQERMDIISNATEEMGLRFRTVEITPEVRKENDDIRFRVTDNNLTGFKIKTNDIGIDINRMEDNAVMPETVPYDIKE